MSAYYLYLNLATFISNKMRCVTL